MTPETRRELQQLLSALCDRELDNAESARLEALLADAEGRRLYLEYLDTHARLLTHPRFGGALPVEPAAAAAPARRPVRQVFRYAMVAAGTLAASLLLQVAWWALRPPGAAPVAGPSAPARSTEYVATLTLSADSAWDDAGEPRHNGARLTPGNLRLRRGVARVRFDGGAELVVEGPAVVRLDSAAAATVLAGKVVFHADETTAAFELHTPTSTLVHLGTEYAVAVGPEGEEVQVFDGKVERTPRGPGAAGPEQLAKGEARRYGTAPGAPGRPEPLDPARFVRRLPGRALPQADAAAGLLSYDGFDYPDAEAFQAGRCAGGVGWAGPWLPDFVRPLNPGDTNRLTLNPRVGLTRPHSAVAPVGGSFDYTGFTKCFRRLAAPVRLDEDGVYYLSYLFRRQGPQSDTINAVAVLFWTDDDYRTKSEGRWQRLNVGVGGANELFTHLQQVGTRAPLPLSDGVTYLLVAKIVASAINPDQVFLRVYSPDEPVEREEPGSWTAVGPPFYSDLVFDWLQLHVNSRARQTIDEIRLGTTWSSVTAPWSGRPR